jgi:phosphomannomutase / phosphoglucomutase
LTNIDAGLFRKYDVRGEAEGVSAPLNESNAFYIGQAFGTFLQVGYQTDEVVVGQDNRSTSPTLANALIDGLQASGCTVIDIGQCSTPIVYWAVAQRTHADVGGVMVTGSHLAPQYNGFKLCVGRSSIHSDQIQTLYEMIRNDALMRGSGNMRRQEDIIGRYVADVSRRITMPRKLRVVVDAGNGTAGLVAPSLLRVWGQDMLACLYCEPDSRYPNHQPDPSQPKNLQALIKAVHQTGADVGFAFDGDADRVGVVDNAGNPIAPDRILTLLAQDLLARQPNARVIADVSCSQVFSDAVTAAGGQPILWQTGHSLIKEHMQAQDAPLAGEISGHMFFAENYYGFDDGYFAMGRVLQLLGNSAQSLSELDAALPRLHSSPVYRPHCPPEVMPQVIQAVQDELQHEGRLITIDGVRVNFQDGWGLIRASNTEPVLSLRFEGRTAAITQQYQERFFAIMRRFSEVVFE